MNKIRDFFYNTVEYIKEHFIRFIIIILLFFTLCICFTFLPRETIMQDGNMVQQHILLYNITFQNWFSCISIISLIITAIWAVYQFDKSVSRKQQEKGAEISKIVAQDLLHKCTILGNVILASELNSVFNFDTMKPQTFKYFDKNELSTLLNQKDEDLVKVKSIINSSEIQQIYFRYLELNVSKKSYDDVAQKAYSDEDATKLFILGNTTMPFKFVNLVSDVLNNLEYISMYIASQSAGSKYIYQSLHQFFISTIKLLAPIICLQNKDCSDKYYTNTIYVYNYWCLIRQKDLKKEKKNKEKSNKILNPKIKTV